ncbi:MAG: sigma-54-dependent Fis family transcriptional regulator [Proteobacteria bacterium]|nr:sigma-54-dependent Fis family transcriptional regulator [Pseudomonadota bacterium]
MAHDILIVDDEADIRVLTSGILQDEGYQTREAAGSADALSAVEARRPSLVLLDIWLQGSEMDGLGILKILKRDHPAIPVLMMSGHGNIETAVTAIKDGAYDFIEKPFKADRLIVLVERAIETDRLRRENEELRLRAGTANELIGQSQAIREVKESIDRVAPTNSRVLITGPAGSGKEVVARMLHAQSRRAKGPFVVINCATLLPERVEIELFGAEYAGPDGETQQKVGTFEAAHNGTLFLDEVADMPLETQGKIVRVLQEQVFERVGGTTRIEVDVRVVAASTADLTEEIAAGRFREDFFYRLNVVPIEVPPLKKHPDDIPLLARHFMERAATATGRPRREVNADAVAVLQAYSWPGNVRELRNVIERLLIMAPDDPSKPIGIDMLPPEINADAPVSGNMEGNMEIMGLGLRDAREIFEREYLMAQVTRFGGNISKTAEFIGMERSALHRKLKSLGVRNEDRQ